MASDIKVAVIGAGSTVFTPGLLADMCQSPALRHGRVALMDVDAGAVDTMVRLGRRIAAGQHTELQIEGTTDRRAALAGANFVTVTVAAGGAEGWRQDVDIPAQYGFAQTVGDSVGPGGVFRALRHIPILVGIARDMEQLCPDGWLFNYTNPLSALVRAVTLTSRIKCLGLCHGILGTRRHLARVLDVDPQGLQVQAAGINHLTWVLDLRLADGTDAYPVLRQRLDTLASQTPTAPSSGGDRGVESQRQAAAWRDWEPISYRLLQTYGAYPSPGDRHVAEFYPHFLKARDADGLLRHGLQRGLDSTYRFINDKHAYWDRLRAQADGHVPLSEDLTRFGREGERVVHIMEALLGETDTPARTTATNDHAVLELAVNVPNDGQISNLPTGAIVEVPALIGPFGVRALAMGPLPPAIAATLEQRIRQQELTVQAALTGDRHTMRQALLADALVDSYDGAVSLLDEMLEAQRAHLPQFFQAT